MPERRRRSHRQSPNSFALVNALADEPVKARGIGLGRYATLLVL